MLKEFSWDLESRSMGVQIKKLRCWIFGYYKVWSENCLKTFDLSRDWSEESFQKNIFNIEERSNFDLANRKDDVWSIYGRNSEFFRNGQQHNSELLSFWDCSYRTWFLHHVLSLSIFVVSSWHLVNRFINSEHLDAPMTFNWKSMSSEFVWVLILNFFSLQGITLFFWERNICSVLIHRLPLEMCFVWKNVWFC